MQAVSFSTHITKIPLKVLYSATFTKFILIISDSYILHVPAEWETVIQNYTSYLKSVVVSTEVAYYVSENGNFFGV